SQPAGPAAYPPAGQPGAGQPYPPVGQAYPGAPQPAAYPPPGYPAGPGYPPYPQAPKGTDGFAIAAFIWSILGGTLFPIILAIVSLRRIKRDGRTGRGLAISALIISAAWIVLVIAVVVYAVTSSPQRDTAGKVTQGGTQGVQSVRVGDCLKDLGNATLVTSVKTVPCTEPHSAQVMSEFRLADGAYPGEDAIVQQAESRCPDMIPTDLGPGVDLNALNVYYLYPQPDTWTRNDRTVQCILVSDKAPLTAPLPLH
ncbi:MAG TPA: DUF4190 domain-containing protein, partial [Kineosporiaceae bacterium]|nr:DUF4190 domain-containing protein [Kineosporiaceae bacterium]